MAKHGTLLFMISVSVVKFRCTDDLKQLDSILAQINSQNVFSLDIENSPIPQEVATILAFNQGGLLLACVRNKQDLADLIMFLKRDSHILSNLKWKCLVFEDYQPNMLQHALSPFGLTDIFPLRFNPAIVKLRIENFLKSFLPTEEIIPERKSESSEGISWTDPLNLEADIWLLEDLSHCRKVLNSWVISIQGPSTHIGTWEKVAPKTWAFKISENEKEIFGVGGGRWLVEAVAMPKLDWQEKRWVIQGQEIQLYYRNGEEKIHKIFSRDGSLQITKDSLHAQMKRDLILNSFSDKFIFKVEAKKEEVPELEVEAALATWLELKLVPIKEEKSKSKKLQPPPQKVLKKNRLQAKRQKTNQRKLQRMNSSNPTKVSSLRGRKVIIRPKPLPLIKSSQELDRILQDVLDSLDDALPAEYQMIEDPSLESLYKLALEEESQQNFDLAIAAHLQCLTMDELFYDSLEHLFFLYDSLERYEEAYEIGCRIIYNFGLNQKVSCRVIHLVFVLETYDDILPLSVRMLNIGEPDDNLTHYMGTGLFLIGRNYLEQDNSILAFACFDLIAEHNDLLGKYLKYIVLSLLQMNRLDDALVYQDFVEDQLDRDLCSKASQLGMITDVSEFICDAKKTFLQFTDISFKKFLLSKLKLFGFSEEDALQQLKS